MVERKTKTILACTCELKRCGKSWESDGEDIPKRCRWCGNSKWNGAPDLRITHLLTANGKTQRISLWAKETGIAGSTIRARIFNYGWTHEEALGLVKRERQKKGE